MSGQQPAPRWQFLLQPRWLCWHLLAIIATVGMLWLGDWQLHRAESGNELSWAYTFEWPLFAIFGLYFWFRTVRDEYRAQASGGMQAVATTVTKLADEADAEERATDRSAATADAYLARLQAEVRGHGRWHGLR